jgi:hypothetical protein
MLEKRTLLFTEFLLCPLGQPLEIAVDSGHAPLTSEG